MKKPIYINVRINKKIYDRSKKLRKEMASKIGKYSYSDYVQHLEKEVVGWEQIN